MGTWAAEGEGPGLSWLWTWSCEYAKLRAARPGASPSVPRAVITCKHGRQHSSLEAASSLLWKEQGGIMNIEQGLRVPQSAAEPPGGLCLWPHRRAMASRTAVGFPLSEEAWGPRGYTALHLLWPVQKAVGGADTVGRAGHKRGRWAGPEAAEELEACGQRDCSVGLRRARRKATRWTQPHAVGTGLHGGFVRPASFLLPTFVYESGLSGVSAATRLISLFSQQLLRPLTCPSTPSVWLFGGWIFLVWGFCTSLFSGTTKCFHLICIFRPSPGISHSSRSTGSFCWRRS